MTLAFAILAGPLVALLLMALVPPLRRSGRPAAYLSILGIGVSLIAAIAQLLRFWASPTPASADFLWAPLAGGSGGIRFGFLIDGLSAPMLVIVCLVALLVQIYSLGYMHDEKPASLGRYYAFQSLFAFAMLGLVLSHNTLQTYVFWELVGLGSYLLIGFWYRKPEAARAAMKAFWTTRLGDVGFAIGVVLLWTASGTFVFSELFARATDGSLAGTFLTLGVAGLFIGAMGKSAQFPLHIWLPDAMEGPTPVSALIHAATMVAAGVYLMARIAPLLAHAPAVSAWVLGLGVVTALLAATMALVARDVKRILAFSTVSQLGYMMTAVGAGATVAGFFHLSTHAFFKALLFLAAGSLIHAVHTNDIFEMGRLWKKMPITGAFFLVGGLALAGVWPFSGFFSKDEILLELWGKGHTVAFALLLLTAGLTAFYMFRTFFVVFFGEREAQGHAHESPAIMIAPMGVLAVLAVIAGFFGHSLSALMGHSISVPSETAGTVEGGAIVPALGLSAAIAGIVIAWLGYQRRAFNPAAIATTFAPITTLLQRRYYIDEIFLALYRWLYLGVSSLVGWVDRYIVDGLVNWLTWLTYRAAQATRATQTGKAQDALYAVAIGFLLLVCLAWLG